MEARSSTVPSDLRFLLPSLDDTLDEQDFPSISSATETRRVTRNRTLRNPGDQRKQLPFGSACPTSKDVGMFKKGSLSDSSWSVVSSAGSSDSERLSAPMWASSLGPEAVPQPHPQLLDSKAVKAARGDISSSENEQMPQFHRASVAKPRFGSAEVPSDDESGVQRVSKRLVLLYPLLKV